MNKIDYKKMFKEIYAPKMEPSLITVPPMQFIMIDGCGNPNDPNGEYSHALEVLYALTYTIKMGRKFGSIHTDENDLTDYVVPPLEGLWWMQDRNDIDLTQKEKFIWTSMIRQPDFITEAVFVQALAEVNRKKPELDLSKARFQTFEEGLCVQCMHIGSFDNESGTVCKMEQFIKDNGLANAIGTLLPNGLVRRHHEIYLSDFRKANPATMKTIVRHPVCY